MKHLFKTEVKNIRQHYCLSCHLQIFWTFLSVVSNLPRHIPLWYSELSRADNQGVVNRELPVMAATEDEIGFYSRNGSFVLFFVCFFGFCLFFCVTFLIWICTCCWFFCFFVFFLNILSLLVFIIIVSFYMYIHVYLNDHNLSTMLHLFRDLFSTICLAPTILYFAWKLTKTILIETD